MPVEAPIRPGRVEEDQLREPSGSKKGDVYSDRVARKDFGVRFATATATAGAPDRAAEPFLGVDALLGVLRRRLFFGLAWYPRHTVVRGQGGVCFVRRTEIARPGLCLRWAASAADFGVSARAIHDGDGRTASRRGRMGHGRRGDRSETTAR